MKTKKFLILAVLVVMMSMLFTGCNHNITENVEKAQTIAEEFLSTKGYEIPRGYTVKYVDENQTKLSVKYEKLKVFETRYNKVEVIFDISGGEADIIYISNLRITINKEQIDECKKIASDFLNTVGYQMPGNCQSIEYLGDSKNKIKVTTIYQMPVNKEKSKNIEMTITFDIENELNVLEITYYENEGNEYAPFILVASYVGIIIMVIIIIKFDTKKESS